MQHQLSAENVGCRTDTRSGENRNSITAPFPISACPFLFSPCLDRSVATIFHARFWLEIHLRDFRSTDLTIPMHAQNPWPDVFFNHGKKATGNSFHHQFQRFFLSLLRRLLLAKKKKLPSFRPSSLPLRTRLGFAPRSIRVETSLVRRAHSKSLPGKSHNTRALLGPESPFRLRECKAEKPRRRL